MRKNPHRNIMIRFTLLIIILSSLVWSSCSSRNNKIERSNLIPEKELISVLTDLYITNGLLTVPKIRDLYSNADSVTSYNEVIEKHGYTKATMDKTMKYYFIKKPKELIKIYDQVLGRLSEMETRIEKEVAETENRISNLWKGKEFYAFPDDTGSDSTGFSITTNVSGMYLLTFRLTMYPDDQSVNPRLTAYTCNTDSIETGKKHFVPSLNYLKDGQPHMYSIIVNATDKSSRLFRGVLYDFDNNPEELRKHLLIDKISFTFTPGPA